MCVNNTQVLAFKRTVNANMPEITKTPGNDEGVQYDFKELFIKVAKKEVCNIKSINIATLYTW